MPSDIMRTIIVTPCDGPAQFYSAYLRSKQEDPEAVIIVEYPTSAKNACEFVSDSSLALSNEDCINVIGGVDSADYDLVDYIKEKIGSHVILHSWWPEDDSKAFESGCDIAEVKLDGDDSPKWMSSLLFRDHFPVYTTAFQTAILFDFLVGRESSARGNATNQKLYQELVASPIDHEFVSYAEHYMRDQLALEILRIRPVVESADVMYTVNKALKFRAMHDVGVRHPGFYELAIQDAAFFVTVGYIPRMQTTNVSVFFDPEIIKQEEIETALQLKIIAQDHGLIEFAFESDSRFEQVTSYIQERL